MAEQFNEHVIKEFRANGGRVGGMFEGAPLVLLTTAGARTGRAHTTPAVYVRESDRILVFGSNAGGPKHPAWYHNLLADPQVTVEIGTDDGRVESYSARAVPLEGEERDRAFQRQADRDPAFAAYQAATTRIIPVIALHRLDLAADPERNRAIGRHLVTVHAELRQELATVRRQVEDFLAGHAQAPTPPSPALGRQLAQHCLSFCDSLHMHHIREDGAFTDFERQFPQLRPALDRLRREHHVVARALTDLRALLADLASNTDAERVRADLARLATELEDHFAYEEQHLLPVLDPAGVDLDKV
jgi:deazaflavin-dependent oxidoreductase (nitroreductase family)